VTLTTLGYAFLGGLLPSFIWLYFLLREDVRCPEPRSLITFAFIAGMIAVPLAIPLEQWGCARFAPDLLTSCASQRLGFNTVLIWVIIEEVLKYAMAAVFILWRHAVDEAPDYVIYMITVALGFAAAENMLYLLQTLLDPNSGGHFMASFFTTGNMRFLGSTLVHVVSSAFIGFAFAFSARSHPLTRMLAASSGLILAITLHTAFNTLIINQGTSTTLTALFLVWMVAVVFFAAFEVLKYFQYRNQSNNTC
jgi:RsiW-degrading membrane proteinase PrsW (M82 family)